MYQKTVLIIGGLVIFTLLSFSQFKPPKFGKPSEELVKSTTCPIDSTAEAYIVFDEGDTFFYLENNHWRWKIIRRIMIKILTKSGYEWSDFVIPYYNIYATKENVVGIKGFTYNYENGEIIKAKLEKDQIFKEVVTDNYNKVKISFPNVKEGSLIELSYSLESDFFAYLRPWQFQYGIPVLQSQYTIKIPEYFNYQVHMKGYETLTRNTTTSQGTMINQLEFTVNIREMTAVNLPALKEEAYVNSIDNYRSAIEFELKSIFFPGSIIKEYTTSWNRVNEKFLDSEYFGKQLDKSYFAKEDIADIINKYSDSEDLLKAIYEQVKNNIKWNGKYGVYTSDPLRKVYKDKIGNASEINFILINLLRAADIEAYPVIISTRSNGMIFPIHPTMDKFNYMIVQAHVKNKIFLLDATDPYCPFGMLPIRCLNDKGRIVDSRKCDWVDLTSKIPYDEKVYYSLNLNGTGDFSGKLVIIHDGYAGYQTRQKIENEVTNDKYIEELCAKRTGLEVESFDFSDVDDIYSPLKCEMDIIIKEQSQYMGDLISFNPTFYERISDNPFKMTERKFPVDYAYPIKKKIYTRIDIPEGYEVESLPESVNLKLPDNGGSFIYNVNQVGNIVQVVIMFDINKSMYLPNEYQNLKEFYAQIIGKNAEQIIFKKSPL